jgi:hypothetical protein
MDDGRPGMRRFGVVTFAKVQARRRPEELLRKGDEWEVIPMDSLILLRVDARRLWS